MPRFKIHRVLLETQFQRSKDELGRQVGSPSLDELRQRVTEEYESFGKSVLTWTALREQSIAVAKQAMAKRWEKSNLHSKLKALEDGLGAQYRRMQLIGAQLGSVRV